MEAKHLVNRVRRERHLVGGQLLVLVFPVLEENILQVIEAANRVNFKERLQMEARVHVVIHV